MKRVLHIYCGPFPTMQGTQVLVEQLCELSSQNNFETTLLTYAGKNDERGKTTKKKSTFNIVRIPDIPKFTSLRSGPALAKYALDISMAAKTAMLIKKLQPHIIHAHHYEALVTARLADPLKKVPLLFHQHAMFGPELYTYASKKFAPLLKLTGNTMDRWLPRTADKIITVSKHNKNLLETFGISPSKIDTLYPPAVNLPGKHPAHSLQTDTITAVYTGNLDNYQGLNNLTSALLKLPQQIKTKLKILIITGSNFESYRTNLNINLRKMIKFVYSTDFDQTFTLMHSADFAIIPRSLSGGMPVKLINSLAAKLPVIADAQVADGLSQQHGVQITSTNNAEQFAKTIEQLIVNKKLRKQLAQNSSAGLSIFDSHNIAGKLIEIYQKTIAKN